MARDEKNERGKIGAEVNEMQRMVERLEREREKERREMSRRNKTSRATTIVKGESDGGTT